MRQSLSKYELLVLIMRHFRDVQTFTLSRAHVAFLTLNCCEYGAASKRNMPWVLSQSNTTKVKWPRLGIFPNQTGNVRPGTPRWDQEPLKWNPRLGLQPVEKGLGTPNVGYGTPKQSSRTRYPGPLFFFTINSINFSATYAPLY